MPASSAEVRQRVRWHLQFAWWSLVCFVVLGITLESLHAFKVVWYLGEDYQTRRLMWTLAHAHGVLLSLVHVAFAATLFILYQQIDTSIRRVSRCLVLASLLLPGGFFLGGIQVYDADPGIGVWLVPLGAFFLLAGVLVTAMGTTNSQD